MTFKYYRLTPVDTWFFRDGRPYNQGESNLASIKSLFPPFAVTAVGAIRASFARSLGWNGKGDWNAEIKAKLGDGSNLKPLRFKGPYLIRKKEEKSEVLLPAPLHLLGRPSDTEEGMWEKLTILKPGEEVDCDIGEKVRLPSSKDAIGLKSLYGCYLNSSDMEVVQRGDDLSKVHPINGTDLWDFEFLVGIERDSKTHTAVEGALYNISRVRLKPDVSLVVGVEGIEAGIELQSPLPFGGEGRMAFADLFDEPIKIPDAAQIKPIDGVIQFTITHITPTCFEDAWPGPGKEVPGIKDARVVSACLERSVRIGGWNSLKKEPLPLKPFLPEGSTWFCESEADGTRANEIMKLNGQHIGKYTEYGFGEIAVGLWSY